MRKRVGEIRISERTVRIGHEVYPLANISRVRTLRLVPGGRRATFYPLREIGTLVGAAVVVAVMLDTAPARLGLAFMAHDTARRCVAAAAVLAAARVAWLLAVVGHRLLLRRPRYALLLETSGDPRTVLTGTDRGAIHRVQHEIVDAIDNPPEQQRSVHVGGDLVMGDKVGRDKYAAGRGTRRAFTT
ncbi:hypothetical protein E2C00_16865 [Streptomyces sp. WAC05374]|nr:hypothetical protein EF905_31370 [Streptomyces sp. WAC05374]TDF54596.1 hypothetical protein E2C00_16865 [Streptomyces sp. WAC05374]TDF56231.1 hypothetical protein E2C02_12320 [Streptomyces sp. WAC05374]